MTPPLSNIMEEAGQSVGYSSCPDARTYHAAELTRLTRLL